MPRAGPRKVQRYSLEFKLKAVKLSQLKGIEVQAVADALEIHPFMLSRWRKEARDGVLRGRASVPRAVKTPPARDMRRFHALQRAHALEQIEQRHPSLYRSICDETGTVRRHVNLFVNMSHVRDREGLDTALVPGDVVIILPAISGG